MTTQIFLPGAPPTTTTQTRAVRVVRGKPIFYEPDALCRARERLQGALIHHVPDAPYDCGVRLTVKWLFPYTKGHHDGEYKLTRPDTDNLQKLLKDVMTRLGFWVDDSLVCSEIVEKFWADQPGIFIRIEELST